MRLPVTTAVKKIDDLLATEVADVHETTEFATIIRQFADNIKSLSHQEFKHSLDEFLHSFDHKFNSLTQALMDGSYRLSVLSREKIISLIEPSIKNDHIKPNLLIISLRQLNSPYFHEIKELMVKFVNIPHTSSSKLLNSEQFNQAFTDFAHIIKHYDDKDFKQTLIDLYDEFSTVRTPISFNSRGNSYGLHNDAIEKIAHIINEHLDSLSQRAILIHVITGMSHAEIFQARRKAEKPFTKIGMKSK